MSRVVYIGNFVPPHSTENEVSSCFRALGWDVQRVQEDQAAHMPAERWTDVRAACTAADLVLYTRTWGLPETQALGLWNECAENGVPTASLHLDLFYGLGSPKGQLPRHEMPAHDPMFRTAYVFTPDGDHDDEWERDGVNHYWLPPAIGCDSCWDGTRDERWAGYDVAFVGSRSYHPEWPHRPRLIDELARRFGEKFVHISGETLGSALRGQALHDLYATVPVIVGDSCWVGTKPPDTRYWSDRVYEVWGRGGFLLMPYIAALDQSLHTPDSYPGWDRFDDFDDMEHVIRYWLDRPDERAVVGKQIVEEVRTRHTWSQRITEMLDVIGLPKET